MIGPDADKLAALQQTWEQIFNSKPEQCVKNIKKFEDLVIGLKDLGLHTAYDSTYELLSPGLDREQFRHKRTEMFLLAALDTYHAARHIPETIFLGDANRVTQKNLRQLLAFDLPAYETHVASTGLSATINPLWVQEIKDLCALKTAGALDAELARMNVECVKDAFRNAHAMNAEQVKLLAKGGEVYYRPVKMALAYAQQAVKGMESLGDKMTPQQIPAALDSDGYWTSARVGFDRAALVGLRDALLLRACGIEFKDALGLQASGHFAVAAQGEGRDNTTLPLQRIVQTLTAHKYNMQVPSMFAAMGTTRNAFFAAYHREREAVAASPVYADQLAPEFKPGR